jgi:hypothetical protein
LKSAILKKKSGVSRIRLFFSTKRYSVPVPTAHTCLVSFTDTNNISHAVEVAANTLYEAATLAMVEFRSGFTENAPGPATRLMVTVKAPSTGSWRWVTSLRLEISGRPARSPL